VSWSPAYKTSRRVCHLLEVWIQDYPHDFAVGAAADALNALVKSIVTKTHLLHYGSDLLPFLEGRPLQDKDYAWALKVDEPTAESDEPYSFSEDDDDVLQSLEASSSRTRGSEDASSTQTMNSGRERKSSLPLSARSNGTSTNDHVDSVKEILKSLLSTSARLSGCEPQHVAEEITRVGKIHFLLIEVRNHRQSPVASSFHVPFLSSLETGYNMYWFLGRRILRLILSHVSMECANIWRIGAFPILVTLSPLLSMVPGSFP
jgi:hypothetical protein